MYRDENILNIKLDAAALTDPGKIREKNEDSILMMNEHACFAVADGMGGGEGGEIASKMIIDAIENEIKAGGTSPASRERGVIRSSYHINELIGQYCLEHNFETMGTTLACLLMDSWNPNFCTVFHSGDSRIYRFRDGTLQLLTRDHTLANLNNVEEKNLPKSQQGVLTNILGMSNDFFLERNIYDIRRKDMFLLCSDGLNRMVDDASIADILKRSSNTSSSI